VTRDDRGTVTVEVELTEALVDLICREFGNDVDLSEWTAGAAEMRVRHLFMEDKRELNIDIPEDVAERAELLAEHGRVRHEMTGYAADPADWITEIADLGYRFPDEGAEDEGSKR
jgi:hypothetical protein